MGPQDIYSALLSRGVSPVHAVGMMANIRAESSFDPSAIGDSGTSFGLFQHHGPRADAMIEASGGNWRDPLKQIDFALTEPITAAYLRHPFSSPEEASKWFTTHWERPADAERKAAERAATIPAVMSMIGETNMQPVQAIYPGMAPPMAMAAPPAVQPNPLTQLMVDPLFNVGMSLLSAGTSGRDLGSALQIGMTGALRNQLLMDQLSERREQTAYERQAAAAQAQWEREKFSQQQAMAQAKLDQPIFKEVRSKLYRIDPRTGAATQISGPTQADTGTSAYVLDEDLAAEEARGTVERKELVKIQEQRDRTNYDDLVAFRKEYGKANAPAANKIAAWNEVRHLDPLNMNPIQDQKLVKMYAKSILPNEAVMSGEATEIAEAGQALYEKMWAEHTKGKGTLNEQQRQWIMAEIEHSAKNAAVSSAQTWGQFYEAAKRAPGIGVSNIDITMGPSPSIFTPRQAEKSVAQPTDAELYKATEILRRIGRIP